MGVIRRHSCDWCREKTEHLHMPGGALQADRLQVLLYMLVVLDLSRNRDRHRLAPVTTNKFNRFVALVRGERKEIYKNEYRVWISLMNS